MNLVMIPRRVPLRPSTVALSICQRSGITNHHDLTFWFHVCFSFFSQEDPAGELAENALESATEAIHSCVEHLSTIWYHQPSQLDFLVFNII